MHLTIGTADLVDKILWDEETSQIATGGFTLADVLPSTSTYMLKGAPLYVNYTTKVAQLVKTAICVAGSTTTVTRVAKNHQFKVGDVVSKTVGAIGVAITAIDTTTSDSYDTLTHLTNGGAWSADDVLFQAAAVGASSAYKYTANALLSNNKANTGSITLTGVIGALEIEESNLPYSVTTAMKTALGARFQFI